MMLEPQCCRNSEVYSNAPGARAGTAGEPYSMDIHLSSERLKNIKIVQNAAYQKQNSRTRLTE